MVVREIENSYAGMCDKNIEFIYLALFMEAWQLKYNSMFKSSAKPTDLLF